MLKILLSNTMSLLDKVYKDRKENICTWLIIIFYSGTYHLMNVYPLLQVNANLSLKFCIGPDIDATRNFVYWLGTHSFYGIMGNYTEESIRGLGSRTTYDKEQ